MERIPFPLRRVATGLATVLALAAPAAQATTNLVQNGSFENTPVTTTTFFISAGVANWTNSDIGETLVTPNWYTSGQFFPGVGVAGPLPATSPDGGNFVYSDGDYHNSPIVQTITGLTPGAFYQLSFYQALAQDTEIYTTPGAVTGQWQVNFGGDILMSSFMSGNGATLTISPWAQQTMVFQAHTSTQLLSFLSVGTGDPPLVFLDGVSLTAVPEPGTLALMLAGGVFVGWQRRRAARSAPSA